MKHKLIILSWISLALAILPACKTARLENSPKGRQTTEPSEPHSEYPATGTTDSSAGGSGSTTAGSSSSGTGSGTGENPTSTTADYPSSDETADGSSSDTDNYEGNCDLAIVSKPPLSHHVAPSGVDSTTLKAEIRDFRPSHPDFEHFGYAEVRKATKGLVAPSLDADGLPVLVKTGNPQMVKRPQTFAEWYRNNSKNKLFIKDIKLTKQTNSNTYVFDQNEFFPLDNEPSSFGFEVPGYQHNFHFTTLVRTKFVYRGGEVFTFAGDDDVWVFVNNNLAIDLGGTHSRDTQTLDMDEKSKDLGLERGREYSIVVFHAERFSAYSRFRIETSLELYDSYCQAYQYQVKTTGTPYAPLVYKLKEAPSPMTIDKNTGLVSWSPQASSIGGHKVTIEVSDGQCSASQSYHLEVMGPAY